MKKKFNIKTIVIFGVLLVVMVLAVVAVSQIRTFMSGATSDVEPTNVVATSSNDGKSATVTWTSEKESVAKVEYGTTAASLVLMTADTSATKDHNLPLTQLRPATTYYYRIRIGEEVFDNGGIPYFFKTKSESEATTLSPSPTIEVPKTGLTCDPKVDYNKDGAISYSADMMTCKKDGGVIPTTDSSAAVTKTVTKAVTKKVTPTTKVITECNGLIPDYNSDGVINTADRLNCLQSKR